MHGVEQLVIKVIVHFRRSPTVCRGIHRMKSHQTPVPYGIIIVPGFILGSEWCFSRQSKIASLNNVIPEFKPGMNEVIGWPVSDGGIGYRDETEQRENRAPGK